MSKCTENAVRGLWRKMSRKTTFLTPQSYTGSSCTHTQLMPSSLTWPFLCVGRVFETYVLPSTGIETR